MQCFRTLLVLLLIGNLGLPAWGMRSCCCTQEVEAPNQKSCCAAKTVTTASANPQRACCASRAEPRRSENRSSQAVVAEQSIHLCQCVHEQSMIPAKPVRSLNSDENSFSGVTQPLSSETDFAVSTSRSASSPQFPSSGPVLLSQICRWRI